MIIDIPSLKKNLDFDCDIKYFEKVDSTNNAAKLSSGAKEFDLFIAREQTGGKGRQNRQWVSKKDKGLYFSIILKPKTDKLQGITILMAIAVFRVLRSFGFDTNIKWPNDVLIKGKKVCGILTQAENGTLICGTGINVLHDADDFSEMENTATSLKLEKSEVDFTQLLINILNEFYALYAEFLHNGLNNLIDEYQDSLIHTDSAVKLKLPNEEVNGQFLGVDINGGIILNVGGVQKTFICGEVIAEDNGRFK